MSILKELEANLPKNAQISEAKFEGSELILYTKNKDFFRKSEELIKDVVANLKKRIEIRPDPSISLNVEDTKKTIERVVPKDAGVKAIYFEPELGKVVIESNKPGLVIGKGGETYREIKNLTLWLPKIERAPAISSEIVRAVRNLLHSQIGYRKTFLNRIGQKINSPPKVPKENEWIRLSFLGGARQVGRSCILVETPNSNVLLDCGVDVGSDSHPYTDTPEFNLDKLDAVVLSHSHLDHCGFIPWLYEQGYKGPLYCSVDYNEPVLIKVDGSIKKIPIGKISDELINRSKHIDKIPKNDFVSASVDENVEVPAFSFKDYKIRFKPLKNVIRHKITDALFELKVKTGRTVKVTGSHSVFTLKDSEVKPIKVKELKVGDYLVVPHRLPSQDVEEVYINNYLNFPVSGGKIGPRGGFKIPNKIPITKELMRILGYFTAEGNLEERGLRFSFGLKDERFIKDLVYCIRSVFGLSAKERINKETRIRVDANSKILRYVFSKIFFPDYTKATNKTVPEIVFNISDEFKLEFLKAYFAGDGYINFANKTVDAVTVSKNLITDLSYLCSQIGFNYTLFERKIRSAKTKNIVYKITINFSDFYKESAVRRSWRSCELIPIYETGFEQDWYYHKLKDRFHISKERLLELISKNQIKIKTGNSLQIQETLSKLANSDLSFFPITNIRRVKPATEFVYDFSVEGDENFVGGNTPVCLHNTAPTRDLMVLLCLDYIDVCQREGKKVFYTKKSIESTVKHSVVLDYGEVSDITTDVRLTLEQAGHLLGSSLVHLHVGEGLHNILYSADLKFGPSRLFEPAFTNFQRVETLILESTYGGAEDIMPTRRDSEKQLLEIIENTVKRGGKVLIPAFAVGRAQEVMTILAGNGFDHPVWMEGMLWDSTAIHTAYPEYLSHYLQRDIFRYGKNPFLSDIFHRVVPKERDSIIDSAEPGVIIATSGMLIGGPAIEYLKALAPDKKNTLLFVGYQGEGTMGRRIQKGWKELPISRADGKTRALKLEMDVETVDGLSGHSDRNQLIRYVYKLSSKPERVVINHGDNYKCIELARDVHKLFRCETLAPKNLEVIRLK